MADALAGMLVSASESGARIRVGVVVASTGSALTVVLGSADVVVTGRLASYTPVVGHVVLVLVDGSSIVVLGRVMSA
jgi:hypothetical protein